MVVQRQKNFNWGWNYHLENLTVIPYLGRWVSEFAKYGGPKSCFNPDSICKGELYESYCHRVVEQGKTRTWEKGNTTNLSVFVGILPDFRIKQKQSNAEKTLAAHTGSIFRCRVVESFLNKMISAIKCPVVLVFIGTIYSPRFFSQRRVDSFVEKFTDSQWMDSRRTGATSGDARSGIFKAIFAPITSRGILALSPWCLLAAEIGTDFLCKAGQVPLEVSSA